ncbi:MAG: tetratricopeptide repeat protein [Balneolaceae bacterium]
MTKDFWQILTFIIDRVLEFETEEQMQFIERECNHDPELKRQVIKFLGSIHKSEGLWDQLLTSNRILADELTSSGELLSEISEDPLPDRIGPYKIIKRIARGGMGDVYLAERSDGQFHRTVAIKILRRELAHEKNKQRFFSEREILSSLEHPNIARLYDGGITDDGRPYLVMEFIDGKPISSFCSENNCTLEHKLTLFTQVCQAVNYAHTNLIIHRDLKPDNIFVTSNGTVKILDFGIAKIIDSELSAKDLLKTQQGLRLLSIQYAAPEQITLEKITTATDVYGLGLLLYEMITGKKPFKLKNKKLKEAEYIIRHQSPEPPSLVVIDKSISEKLKGDLDAITLKALRKHPEERYQSADQILDDIHRYQNHLPVHAQKDSIHYRITKFGKRHSNAIITLLVLIFMLSGLALYHTHQITTQRNIAQSEANKAQQAVSFLIQMFESGSPVESLGDTLTVYDLLQRGIQNTEVLNDQPVLKAQMYGVIGRVYRTLGEYQNARSLLEKSYNLRLEHLGLVHPETVESLDQIGILLSEEGKFSEAESFLRLSDEIRIQLTDSVQASFAITKNELAYVLRRQGKFDESKEIYENLIEIYRKHLGDEDELTISSMSGLAAVLHGMNSYSDAEKYYRKVLSLRKNKLGPVHPDLAMSMNSLGSLLMNMGKFKEAEQLLRVSLEMRKSIYGLKHPKVALTTNNLAILLRDIGEFDIAEKLFMESLQIRKEILGETHIGTCLSKFSLAEHYLLTNRPDSAYKLFNQILPDFDENFAGSNSFSARTKMGIGKAYLLKGDMIKAGKYMKSAFEEIEHLHSEKSIEKLLAMIQMGELYMRENLPDVAAYYLENVYKIFNDIEYDYENLSIYRKIIDNNLRELNYFSEAQWQSKQ